MRRTTLLFMPVMIRFFVASSVGCRKETMTMRHMEEKDRYYIEKCLKKKMKVSEIARDLGFSRQAVYAEIKKGLTEQLDSKTLEKKTVYFSDVSQRRHREAMKRTGRKTKLAPCDEMLMDMSRLIRKGRYSPEAALRLAGHHKICLKTFYNYVHAGYLPSLSVLDLPYAKEHRKKKPDKGKEARPRRNGGKSIEERPDAVKNRGSFGHWEMDTIYSAQGCRTCLLVLSERRGRHELIFRIKDRTAGSVIRVLNRLERDMGAPRFRAVFHSITVDNGSEFADWQGIEKSCLNKGKRTELYFCHPYCSGERGTNENINRMIRRWIPKGDDIGLYTSAEIRRLQDWVNGYPRKIFGGLSSNEYIRLVSPDFAFLLPSVHV